MYITIWHIALSCSPTLIQVESGDSMLTTCMQIPDRLEPEDWWLRFLKYHTVTSLPPIRRRSTSCNSYLQNCLYKLANKCCTFSHYNLMLVDRLFCIVGRADPNSVCSNIVIFVMNIITYQTYMIWPCFEAGGRCPPPPSPPGQILQDENSRTIKRRG